MINLAISTIHYFASLGPPCTLSQGVGGRILGFPTWYKYLQGELLAGECSVAFAFPDDIGKVLLAVVEILLRIAALVAVGFVIVGGFQYITSQGDPQSTNNARGTVINAIIGLVVAIFATVIVAFVAGNLT